MAEAEGYVMVRRPGCVPLVVRAAEWQTWPEVARRPPVPRHVRDIVARFEGYARRYPGVTVAAVHEAGEVFVGVTFEGRTQKVDPCATLIGDECELFAIAARHVGVKA